MFTGLGWAFGIGLEREDGEALDEHLTGRHKGLDACSISLGWRLCSPESSLKGSLSQG